MKKIVSLFIGGILLLLVLGACTAKPEASEGLQTGETSSADMEGFTLNYPADMVPFGFEIPLVLEKMPTRVVSMSVAPVMTLYELGVEIVAVPSTNKIDWPDDLRAKAEVMITTADNFDMETVIALTPDLVILTKGTVDTYGEVLTNVGIPVYYVLDGPASTYDSTKSLTQELVSSFGKSSEAGIALLGRFDDLEKRIEEFKTNTSADKSVMVIHNSPPSTRIQTSKAFLGSVLNMLGYENVNEAAPSSNMPIDMEMVIGYDPDYIFAVSSESDIKDFKSFMEKGFAEIPDFWNSFDAIVNDEIFYMPTNYRSSMGIAIIDDIHVIMNMVEESESTK